MRILSSTLHLCFDNVTVHSRKAIVIILFLASSIYGFSQNIRPDSDFFMLYFESGNNVLEKHYQDNSSTLNKLASEISPFLYDLKIGRAHIDLTGYIVAGKKDDAKAINNISLKASVVRAYFKIKYGLNNDNFSFNIDIIDNPSNTEDAICVAIIHSPVQNGENKNIFFSLNPTLSSISNFLAKYGSIPYKQKNVASIERNYDVLTDDESSDIKDMRRRAKRVSKKATVISSLKGQLIIPKKEHIAPAVITINKSPNKLRSVTFHPYFAIKTNFVYWAGFIPTLEQERVNYIPNLEVEYFFTKRYSISIDAIYTPFVRNKTGSEWRDIDGFAIEPRVWLSDKKIIRGAFRGVYTGFYGITGEFDIMHHSLGNYGYTGSYYGAGVSIGVVFPLFNSGFALEIGARGGYRIDNWESYEANNGSFIYIDSGTQNGFKLQGLKLSIMYRFGEKL